MRPDKLVRPFLFYSGSIQPCAHDVDQGERGSMAIHPMISTIIFAATLVWLGFPVHDAISRGSARTTEVATTCPSGHSEARLTGWVLNNKTPSGVATYNESARLLEVSVDSVGLPDGTVLLVFSGDDRIGQLPPLKDGAATGTITRSLAEGARVRVIDDDRPIVSANLECTDVPTAVPTASPSPTTGPTATATPSPSPSPSATVSPGPTAEPTQDPMPKPSPMETPSPAG
jgi:hypothetical protein